MITPQRQHLVPLRQQRRHTFGNLVKGLRHRVEVQIARVAIRRACDTYTPNTDLIKINKPLSMSNNTQRKVIITDSVEPAEKRR